MPVVHAHEFAVLRGTEKIQPGQLFAGRVSQPTSVHVHTVQRGIQKLHWDQVRYAANENGHIDVGAAKSIPTGRKMSETE